MDSIRANESVLNVIKTLGQRCPRLARLVMSDNNFKINNEIKLNAFVSALSSFRNLQHLDLHDCPLDFDDAPDRIGKVLSNSCEHLVYLNLSYCLDGSDDVKIFLDQLEKGCAKLEELHLADCSLED